MNIEKITALQEIIIWLIARPEQTDPNHDKCEDYEDAHSLLAILGRLRKEWDRRIVDDDDDDQEHI